jgi:hypothetical protein
VPLWVKPTDDPEAGNAELIASGASTAPASIDEVEVAAFFRSGEEQTKPDLELFDQGSMAVAELQPHEKPAAETECRSESQTQGEPEQVVNDKEQPSVLDAAASSGAPQLIDLSGVTFYDLFVAKAEELCVKEPRTTDEMVEALAINKTQLNSRLKQAVETGELKKLTKPVRYEVASSKQGALALE